MNDSQSNLPKATIEEAPMMDGHVAPTILLALICLLSFVTGVFITFSPAYFDGGIFGWGRNYAEMDAQPRGFNMLFDSGYSIALGIFVTIASGICGIFVGLFAGLYSYFDSKERRDLSPPQ